MATKSPGDQGTGMSEFLTFFSCVYFISKEKMFTEITNEEAWKRLPIGEEQRAEFFRLVNQLEDEKIKAVPTVEVLVATNSVDSVHPTAKDPELECEEQCP